MEQWGRVTKIDWRTLKLFDLSRVRLRIAMKDRPILPALLEVTDGDWVFTVVVVVVGDEESRRGSEKSESTWEAVASHSGTGGGRRGERGKSTTRGRYRIREDNRLRKGGERGKVVLLSMGTCGKGCQLPSLSCLNSKKTTDRLDGIEEAVEDRAGGDEAIADVGC